VNKKVDGQRKWIPGGKREKKNGSATGEIITKVKLGIKEKRQEKGEK
jgi:hypothetical protein